MFQHNDIPRDLFSETSQRGITVKETLILCSFSSHFQFICHLPTEPLPFQVAADPRDGKGEGFSRGWVAFLLCYTLTPCVKTRAVGLTSSADRPRGCDTPGCDTPCPPPSLAARMKSLLMSPGLARPCSITVCRSCSAQPLPLQSQNPTEIPQPWSSQRFLRH